jgi:hypothetical protein
MTTTTALDSGGRRVATHGAGRLRDAATFDEFVAARSRALLRTVHVTVRRGVGAYGVAVYDRVD